MDKFRNYDIVFSGLKNGKHEFRFEIDKKFFQLFDTEQEFTEPKVVANILLDKHTTFLELLIKNSKRAVKYCEFNNYVWHGDMTEDSMRSIVKDIRKKTFKNIVKNISGIGYQINV